MTSRRIEKLDHLKPSSHHDCARECGDRERVVWRERVENVENLGVLYRVQGSFRT